VQIYDTSPLRGRPGRRRRIGFPSPEVHISALSAATGFLAILLGLTALPLLGLSDLLPEAYNRVEVPLMPGSDKVKEVELPSAALLASPAIGALIAMLGIGPRRGRSLPILTVAGILTCAVALAFWWGQLVWFHVTYGHQGIGLP
jgi:hypothetical protein